MSLRSTVTLRRGGGMTLIELLVVIGVLGLLMAVTLPSLHSVRLAGRLHAEQSSARQLMLAYAAYANVNRERVMPGYAPSSFRAVDASGDPIGDPARRRYLWRIAPYLDFNVEALLSHQHAELLDEVRYSSSHEMYLYHASLVPALGINARWVGGDFSSSANPPACLETDLQNPSSPCRMYHDLFGRFWLVSMTEARRPDQLIVFASARGPAPIEWETDYVEGYHIVESPYFTAADSHWNETFSTAMHPKGAGFVSFRHRDRAVTAFIDGHIGAHSEDALRDMRYWSNDADREDWHLEANVPSNG